MSAHENAAGLAGPRGADRATLDADDHNTPYRVVIASRKGRRICWRRFASRAGALAELRLLHGRGIQHAAVEGPTPCTARRSRTALRGAAATARELKARQGKQRRP